MNKTKLLLTSAALAAAATTGSAATISFSALPAFSTPNPVADVVTGTVFENVTGSVPQSYRSPWKSTPNNGNPLASTGIFTAVSIGSSALYDFGQRAAKATFVWGSPDNYNLVEFLLKGVVVDTASITPSSNIFPATYRQNGATATITDISGGFFDSMRFASSDKSFEYANLSVAPIPLPAAGGMLLVALAGMGAMRRRKTATA